MQGKRRLRRSAGSELAGNSTATNSPSADGGLTSVRATRAPRVPAEALGPVVRELVAQLWESEQRHRLAFEQSAIGMAHATLDGRFIAANGAWCELTGRSREDLRSLSLADLVGGEEHEGHARLRRELLTGKVSSYTLETHLTLPPGATGQAAWLRFLICIGRATNSEPLYLLASVQDVTAIKDAEERQAFLQASYAVECAALERSLDDLRAQMRSVAQANAALEQFLATASHELLTPVTIIQASIQLLSRRVRRRRPSDELDTDLDLLGRVQTQAQALSRVLEDMVQVARVGAGAQDLRVERVDLVAVARVVVAAQRLAHPDRVIQLDVPESATLVVLADADRIAQVVTNYLTNALKYSPPERPIRVHVCVQNGNATNGNAQGEGGEAGRGEAGRGEEGSVARVAVQDEGVGIAPDEQARVWQRFHRVPGVRVQTRSGANLGLGLHICKSIVEQHSGDVGLQSVPGAGSTFYFTLPLAPDALDEPDALCP
ncbi:MAG TPA: ATP-binding protein [Ktedonobacterales bacterium]